MPRRWIVLALAAVSVVLLGIWQVASIAATDPGVAACTKGLANATVALSFSIDHGTDIYRHLPKLGRSPELEDGLPATVVIFSGKVNIGPVFGRFAAPGESLAPVSSMHSGVVCVDHKGVPEIYTEVDTTGATP